MLSVEVTPANLLSRDPALPGQRWWLFLQHLSAAMQLPSEQVTCSQLGMPCAHGVCSEEPNHREHCGGCVCGGPPSLPPVGHQPCWGSAGRLGPPFALTLLSLCLQVLQGEEWCLAGHRQPRRKGKKGCGGRGTKGNSLTESRGGYGLVFIFNNGQL